MITNGIIKDTSVYGIPVYTRIVTSSRDTNVRTLIGMVPQGLTIHNTGNTSVSADGFNHATYLQNVENSDGGYVSWHFTVDKDKIVQNIPVNEMAYHAGDGANGFGNSKTIAIEICENDDYSKSESNAIKFICFLMKEFNFGISQIQPHRKYALDRKLCPRRILKSESTWQSDWSNFQNRIVAEFKSLNDIKVASSASPSSSSNIKVGDTVKIVASGVQWDGSLIPEYYKGKEYKASEVGSNNRVVLTLNNVIMYAIDKKYLSVVGGSVPVASTPVSTQSSYLVKVTDVLNVRSGPGTNYSIVSVIRDYGVYTIIEQQGSWGRLKSKLGWICLDYTERV